MSAVPLQFLRVGFCVDRADFFEKIIVGYALDGNRTEIDSILTQYLHRRNLARTSTEQACETL